jgi:hypothetical protein
MHEPPNTGKARTVVIDMPGWLRIAGIASALLLIPAVNVGEWICTRIEKAWRDRVRWFR